MPPIFESATKYSEMTPRQLLRSLYDTALDAARAESTLASHLNSISTGRVIVVGAGKAAAAMAQIVERNLRCEMSGLVIVPDGYAAPCVRIEVIEASHPLPDERGVQATQRILKLVRGAKEGDTVICLLSGGASALLVAPIAGVSLAEKREIVAALINSGASIGDINCVRKHLSAVKGGRLASMAVPANILTLVVSDVVGNDLTVIASGPTVSDPTTCGEALSVFRRHGISVSEYVENLLISNEAETPKNLTMNGAAYMVARPADALAASAALATRLGLNVYNLGDLCTGAARDGASEHAGIVKAIAKGQGPVAAPCVVLSGGEYTVKVRGAGRGGPNTEFALALAVDLEGAGGVWAIAADTDGIDGAARAAGAFLTPDTLTRARSVGRNAQHDLATNDSAGFFHALQDLFVPGPTLTNVNDFRAIFVE